MESETNIDNQEHEKSSGEKGQLNTEGEVQEGSLNENVGKEGVLRSTSVLSATSQEKMKGERRSTRRQTRLQEAEYNLNVNEEEEPDFLKVMKEIDDDKLTAQDLLTQGNAYGDSDQRLPSKWADKREATPPPPRGGVKITENKYWIPKTLNPLEIELRKYQMKELKDAYDFLEDHKTGMVDIKDVSTIVRACGFEPKHGEVSEILDRINPYYPGNLSFEELTLVFKYKLDQIDPIEEVERAFKLMDLRKKGRVTLEDLKQVSQMVDYEVNDEELQQMIDEALPSPDGDATINGFVNLMTRKHHFDEPTASRTQKKGQRKFTKSYRTSHYQRTGLAPPLQG